MKPPTSGSRSRSGATATAIAVASAVAMMALTVAPTRADELAPAGASSDNPEADAALRRVLRSGCRDGTPAVRDLRGSATAPWAETVVRLCDEILKEAASPSSSPSPPVAPSPGSPSGRAPAGAADSHEGRGRLVVALTVYGIWLGIATDVLFTIDGQRSAIVAPLAGMAAGLGLSLLATVDRPITNGQAWTIITGLDYGSVNGALWAGGLNLDAQGVVGTALATGLTGGAIGLLVADSQRPRHGDIELVRSGLLWGTVGGFLVIAVAKDNISSESLLRGLGVSMDAGFLVGLGLATSFDLSRNRVLIIDAGTLGGGLAGLGVAWLIVGADNHARVLAGAALGGMFAGMLGAAYFTRHLDAGVDLAESTVPALLSRDHRGRWSWSIPGPMPVFDRFGQRVVGATATALGGVF